MNVQKINWPNALRDLSDYLDAVTERAEYDEARAEELAKENERLEQKVKALTKERDELKAKDSAMVDVLPDISESRRRQITTLQDEVARLRAENDRLGQEADRAWKWDALCDYAGMEYDMTRGEDIIEALSTKAILNYARTAVPRVIRPDEVRYGQWIARKRSDKNEWLSFRSESAVDMIPTGGTLVLLADAPEDADDSDDFPCCKKRGGE